MVSFSLIVKFCFNKIEYVNFILFLGDMIKTLGVESSLNLTLGKRNLLNINILFFLISVRINFSISSVSFDL